MEIGSDEWKNIIFQGATYFGVSLESEQLDAMTLYVRVLLDWNKKTNLTAITDPFEIAVKHVVDSIAPYRFIQSGADLLDVGSGAGFPGIPLKIAIPTLRSTHIDASRKKISFQKYVIRTLGFTDIVALHTRLETLAENVLQTRTTKLPNNPVLLPGEASVSNDYAIRQYDVIICRALFTLEQYIRSALPLMTASGMLLALKAQIGGSTFQALNAFLKQATAGRKGDHSQYEIRAHVYTLPFIEAKRTLVMVQQKPTGPDA